MLSVAVIGVRGPLARTLMGSLRAGEARGGPSAVQLDATGADLKGVLGAVVPTVDAAVLVGLLDEADRIGVKALRGALEAVASAGIACVVHVSSALVYGAHADNQVPLPEDAPLRPDPAFPEAFAYAEAERVLSEWADEHPAVRVAILRPAPVVAPGGEGRLATALGGTRGVKAAGDQLSVQFLHIDDLATAIATAADPNLGLAGPLNVAPDGWISDDMAASLVQGVARVGLPARVTKAVRGVAWRLGVGRTPPVAEAWMSHPWVVASDRLRAAGWQPAYTNEEALVATRDGSALMEMSPKRRQEVALAAAGGTFLAGGALAFYLVRRSRRPRK